MSQYNPQAFMPMMIHPGMFQQHEQRDIAVVPARVHEAMSFLHLLMHKELDRPTGGEFGNVIEGKELLPVEEKTKAAACDLLTMYFQGNLKQDAWDQLRYDNLVHEEEKPGTILNCLACSSNTNTVTGKFRANPSCKLCGGSGYFMAVPCHAPESE